MFELIALQSLIALQITAQRILQESAWLTIKFVCFSLSLFISWVHCMERRPHAHIKNRIILSSLELQLEAPGFLSTVQTETCCACICAYCCETNNSLLFRNSVFLISIGLFSLSEKLSPVPGTFLLHVYLWDKSIHGIMGMFMRSCQGHLYLYD